MSQDFERSTGDQGKLGNGNIENIDGNAGAQNRKPQEEPFNACPPGGRGSSGFAADAMGERIARLRKQKGLTQAQVAELLGISGQAVSKWESNLSCPDIMTLVPLAHVLGVSTDELLGAGEHVEESVGGQSQVDRARPGSPQGASVPEHDFKAEADAQSAGKPQAERPPEPERSRDVEFDAGRGAGREPEDREKTGGCQNFVIIPEKAGSGQAVRSLSVSAGACSVVIVCGPKFSLETEGYQEGDVKSRTEDGVWRIKDVSRNNRFMVIGRNAFSKRKMRITIPEGFAFEQVKLSVGAGTIFGEGIRAKASVLEVGAGQITVRSFYSDSSKIKCEMGAVSIGGELRGLCDVSCGMGEVKACLKEPDHYGYQATVGMGEVRIGGSKIGGMGGSQTVNAGDTNFYKISCSMGSVVFQFE